MAAPTFSGTTITIPSTGTSFDELATALASNTSFGSASASQIRITATVYFQSGARLTKGSSRRNTIIFGQNSISHRMISQSFNQTNKGILDFGEEGILLLEERGYIGSGQATFQIGITANKLTFVNSFTSGNSSYHDLFYRSGNTISSLDIRDKLTVIANNTHAGTMGLLVDSSLAALGDVEFVLGDNATAPINIVLNGPNDVVFPSIVFPYYTSKSAYDVSFFRNAPQGGSGFNGTCTFNAPVFSLDKNINFLTWCGGTTNVDNPVFKNGFTSEMNIDVLSMANGDNTIRIRYDFSAPEYDAIGNFSIRVWDKTGEQISATNTSIGTRKVIWKEAIGPDGVNNTVLNTRADTKILLRKAGYQELLLSFTEYKEVLNFLAPPVVDILYGGSVIGTKISTSQELYDAIRQYEANNLTKTLTGVKLSGKSIDVGTYNIVIDSNALQVFDFDGTTITIKSSAFDGTIKTTGTVLDGNGNPANKTIPSLKIEDANGNSFLSFSGVVSWRVYATEANRDADASALDTGTANNIYRFNFVANTTYYLRLYTSAATFIGDAITPTKSGETKVSLETAGQLATILTKINAGVRTDESALHAALDSYAKKADWKADTTPLATEKTASAARDHARAANLQTQTA